MGEGTIKYCGNPRLEAGRIILRKLEISDAQDIFEYARHPDVARFVTWDPHTSVADAESFISWTLERYEKDEAGEWGIELKETGKIIGTIGFVEYDARNFSGTIGYALSKEYWGKGIMTEAVKRVIKFAFEDMKLNRVEAVHVPENEGSGRVMQKAGMVYEGFLRQRMFAKGRFWDLKQYSIVKDDILSFDAQNASNCECAMEH
ncbi:MAG: GNAT family N-acetyltransferase [Clostridia bacterium]|nr:GNAT family N-acetyltransferase [Clostridia bacterium]